jgi:L-alanine-DL-glutamate epimerase-like enolase superfamily enzyme
MKITQVEVIPLARKLPQAFEGGTYRVVNRFTLVTRIHTDEGVTGEVFGGDEDHTQAEIVGLIRDHFAPMLVGEDPRDVERLWAKMFHSNIDLGNRGLHAVDNALWDLAGKLYGVPLYKLLGGTRDRVPVIAIGGYYKAADGAGGDPIHDEIAYYRELGLAGMKFKVGRATIAEDIRRVTQAREAAGDDFLISCDANQAWTPAQAIEFCRGVEDLNIAWMEEPVRWYDQLEGLRRVRESTSIPINAGQGEISAFGCRDLVIHKAVDILNVDATVAPGITEWRRIAALAHLFHVDMAHHEEPQIALHLLAAIPNGLCVEIFPSYERDPMWADLVVEHPRIADGFMYLPSDPGTGLQLNEDVIEKYRV